MRTGRGRPGARGAGFTYLSLIIVVAIIGLVGAATLKLGSVLQRGAAEQALLDIGAEFSDALQSYANATPAGQPPQPPSLKELLKDPRFPGTRRHLRKIFVDPMTGKAEWGVVYLSGQTGVVSVYSLSDAKAVKLGHFPARFQAFEGRTRVSEWKFSVAGSPLARGAVVAAQPPAPDAAASPAPIAPIAPVAPVAPVAPAPAATGAGAPSVTPAEPDNLPPE